MATGLFLAFPSYYVLSQENAKVIVIVMNVMRPLCSAPGRRRRRESDTKVAWLLLTLEVAFDPSNVWRRAHIQTPLTREMSRGRFLYNLFTWQFNVM